MSKEILFRGKRFDNGEWVISDCIMKLENPCLWVSLDGWVDIIPETLGQFTGLMDKNGKRVFEGDIVNHYVNWLGKRVSGVVQYEVEVASWVCDFIQGDNEASAFLSDWADGNGCEVIGNKWDNGLEVDE